MSITSRCNGCGSTSLGGILQHMPSCVAAKPQTHTDSIMPSTTITFDSPEDQNKFAAKLHTSSSNISSVSLPDPKDREDLADSLRFVAGTIANLNTVKIEILVENIMPLVDAYTTRAVGESRLSQINKDRAVVLSYFKTDEQLKAFRLDAESIRAALPKDIEEKR